MEHPELGLSVRSIYQYIELGLLTGCNIDLKRKVKFKARKCYKTQITDRGGEFGDPQALETVMDDYQRTSIYYCDPMRSGLKGGIENVHTKLREILPKGTSFEYLTQWDLNLIVNSINSVPRQSLLGLTPYQATKENFDMDVLLALQLKPVDPDKINLTPELIK